jgi:hypothetical protein
MTLTSMLCYLIGAAGNGTVASDGSRVGQSLGEGQAFHQEHEMHVEFLSLNA